MFKGAKRAGKRTPGLRGRVWIDGEEGIFLGNGRISLLERIREYGSIRKAAKAIGMSYRHAWDLVDSMNNRAPQPFVKAVTGGSSGGGAELTESGERAVAFFKKFHAEFGEFLRIQETSKEYQEMRSPKPTAEKASAGRTDGGSTRARR